jgi:surfeit locus 1 family protein
VNPSLALHRRQAWVILLATLIGVAGTARLGLWQLDRAAQKQALQRALDQRGALPPLSSALLARTEEEARTQHYRRIQLRGRWIDTATVFLDNRQMDGRPGFFVVTPLRLADSGSVVLVQRGWAPRDVADRRHLPVLSAAAGEVNVVGHIAPPPSRLFEFDAAASGAIRQNLNLAAYGHEIGTRLAPLTIVQDAPPDPDDGLLRHWVRPTFDVHMHYGYAFQWFALCALMAGLYVWFQLVRPRLQHSA